MRSQGSAEYEEDHRIWGQMTRLGDRLYREKEEIGPDLWERQGESSEGTGKEDCYGGGGGQGMRQKVCSAFFLLASVRFRPNLIPNTTV